MSIWEYLKNDCVNDLIDFYWLLWRQLYIEKGRLSSSSSVFLSIFFICRSVSGQLKIPRLVGFWSWWHKCSQGRSAAWQREKKMTNRLKQPFLTILTNTNANIVKYIEVEDLTESCGQSPEGMIKANWIARLIWIIWLNWFNCGS